MRDNREKPGMIPLRNGTLISFELGVLFVITPIIVAGLWFVMEMRSDLNQHGFDMVHFENEQKKDVQILHERVNTVKEDMRSEVSIINGKLDLILAELLSK